jgi:NAD(P)H-nitrite reductase large subunit
MGKIDYLIVGGGVCGATAAETIRLNDKDCSIAIVSDEPHPLYSRVMLSKPEFFLGHIPFDKIWMKSLEAYQQNNIRFIGGRLAVKLNATDKVLTLDDGQELHYDKLLVATGVRARSWSGPGGDKKGIHILRSLEHGKGIMEAIKTKKNAITVGGGFISFEMDDLLRMAGMSVTHLLRESYYWEPVLDAPSGHMIEAALEKGGVKILRNAEIAEIKGGEDVEGVVLKDGTEIPCDMVLFGIGAYGELDWLKDAGIAINHGILANEYLETNISGIYTGGDIAEFNDLILDEKIQLGNWVNAHEQGRIAALNMLGKKQEFKFVSFYTTQGLGITIAFTGDVRIDEDRTVIARGSQEMGSYARIILKGNEVEGATFINRTQEMSVVSKLIRQNIDVSQHHQELADPNFDLKKLLPQTSAPIPATVS